jgi:preprotein translocase subunit SecD
MPRFATAILVVMLQGCSLGPDTELNLEVDSSDPAVVAETARVLAARFEEFPATLFSSTEYAIQGSTIRFRFRNGAPEPKTLERLYETPGRFRVALATNRFGNPWLTERDVLDVRLAYRNSRSALRIRLTPDAGQRMVRLTTENVGSVLTATLDSEMLLEARIQGVFGKSFEIVGLELDPDSAAALRVVLTTGALPADVRAAPADEI